MNGAGERGDTVEDNPQTPNERLMTPLEASQLLTDEYSAKILLATYKRRISAQEISQRYGIPIAACYRKIRILEEAGLIQCVDRILTQKGKRRTSTRRACATLTSSSRTGSSGRDSSSPRAPCGISAGTGTGSISSVSNPAISSVRVITNRTGEPGHSIYLSLHACAREEHANSVPQNSQRGPKRPL